MNTKPETKTNTPGGLNMDSIDKLGQAASRAAMVVAAEFLKAHNLGADLDALCASIRSHMKAALPAALADARKALEAHMSHAAEATFLSSMVLAGLEAAKECGFPKAA